MQAKHLALVRALPVALIPALRARALDPHNTENTRPFGINPSGGHLYIGRRIRSTDGKRKWEIYGRPAEVLEILDFLEGERKEAESEPSTAIADSVVFIPPPQPPASVTVPVKVVVRPPSKPNESFDQAKHPLTNTWTAALVLLLVAPCLLYLANTLSLTVKTAEQPVRIVTSAQNTRAFYHPYQGQNIGALSAESSVVKTVKDTKAIEPNQPPTMITKTDRNVTRQAQSVTDIGSQMQSLEAQGSRIHRLGLFFKAVEVSAGINARKLLFNDGVPLTDGQIVELSGQKLFDQLGQTATALPKPFRMVWESSGTSTIAAELREALTTCVTAVAIKPDLIGDQLVLKTQSQRLAEAFRTAYGIPVGVTTWRDPDSGWLYSILGMCVVIRE